MTISSRRHTPTVPNRDANDFFPELDLLADTFIHHGVGQAEISRGCTSACSFCVRSHKGLWAGDANPENLRWLLAAFAAEYERHPDIARVLYLVDEEFIGRGVDAIPRALTIATELHQAGFAWETSCRIDQVAHPAHNRSWHLERAQLWRDLVTLGLRRCLFGVESGVTSILERFHKETTSEQNTLAIRTLSALGVPTRFTYITFDQLMTRDELRQSVAYQARTDLLLRPLPQMSVEEIVDGVRDPAFVAAHSTGRPFYTGISYMLVSMECLIGAAYTRKVQAAGLAGDVRPSMGRIDARFVDWRIGQASERAQLFVDRNFALDYTLKSLEKILTAVPHQHVRTARVLIKQAAFCVLAQLADAIDRHPDHLDDPPMPVRHGPETDLLSSDLDDIIERTYQQLRETMDNAIPTVLAALPNDQAALLRDEHHRWATSHGWRLINAADPCGT